MALETKTKTIFNMPQMITSRARELQWGMSWWESQYKEAKTNEALAWKIYDDAIENGDPIEEKNAIFIACKLFEANRIAAWHNWQECKRQYLELMN
jgi:phage-related minor tail protein